LLGIPQITCNGCGVREWGYGQRSLYFGTLIRFRLSLDLSSAM
jgi:hypothetical protein